jgi:Sulfotransferase family
LIAYVHIYKTAGTTLTGILRRNFSTRHFDTRLIQERPAITAAQLKRVLLIYPRLESIAGHAVRTHTDLKTTFPEIRFYTFLRDPVKRVISAFLFTRSIRIEEDNWRPQSDKEIEDSFIDFIARQVDRYCNVLSPGRGDAASAIEVIETKMDFVGLVEHFDESLALMKNWIGRPDFDLRYRRLNDSSRRASNDRRFMPVREEVRRLVAATSSITSRSDIAEMLAERQRGDIALFEHVRTKTFERMRRKYAAGSGPFAFEDDRMAADTVAGQLYRNLVGRPLVPLVARS